MYLKLLVAYGIVFTLLVAYLHYIGRRMTALEDRLDRLD
jgi:CcmD family protein